MSLWLSKERDGEVAIGESHRHEGWEPRESRKAKDKWGFLRDHSEAGGKQGLGYSVWT